ncbi:MAG: hypothetical protein AEth_01167 [Candidatus Argoarchaeum ethanivorans]|uniref:Uncharacterized protein n=1 Tax=Candidatus Argoarchaeum ethanivorans TaxID=2608793 RepID=A0A8B3S114_9EURY|nr:MAG: hypothetical protein AEth_01167 [Candidatus Argoarchaeum ethanivorans]
MGIVESLKETLGFGLKIPKVEEIQKERMRLSIKEDQTIPELRKLKNKWKNLYKEGENKDRYEQRALLRQMNRTEGDIATKDLELAKMDLGIRALDKMNPILSKGKEIFKGEFWDKIEGTLTSEKLMDIMVDENFNEGKVLKRLSEVAKISDKHILDAIDQLPDKEIEAVWGTKIETEELDEILDKKIEDKKRSLEIERF